MNVMGEILSKVTFIFLEASLELVPESMRNHPAILKDAERRKKDPAKILLDDSKHHSAMKNFENRTKRGRPDIIHMCLLSVFDSPLGERSDVFVHTIDGKIIRFSKGLRLPRNYNRFVGLMEQLLAEKRIESSGRILIKIEDLCLDELLTEIDPSDTILLTENGDLAGEEVWSSLKSPVILIGAFPHGDFDNKLIKILKKFNPKFISLGRRSFTSLYVTNKVICLLEKFSGIVGEIV